MQPGRWSTSQCNHVESDGVWNGLLMLRTYMFRIDRRMSFFEQTWTRPWGYPNFRQTQLPSSSLDFPLNKIPSNIFPWFPRHRRFSPNTAIWPWFPYVSLLAFPKLCPRIWPGPKSKPGAMGRFPTGSRTKMWVKMEDLGDHRWKCLV